jgi:hypothetical protein
MPWSIITWAISWHARAEWKRQYATIPRPYG